MSGLRGRVVLGLLGALSMACGTSHPVLPDASVDTGSPPRDSRPPGDAAPDADATIDRDGGLPAYDFTWEAAGTPPHVDSGGSRVVTALGGNAVVWYGGNDGGPVWDNWVRLYDGDAGAMGTWRDLGVVSDRLAPGSVLNGSRFQNGSATRMQDGNVLFAGSGPFDFNWVASDMGVFTRQCLIFGAADRTFTRVADLPHPRGFQGSTLLAGGDVLLVGGVTTPDSPINPGEFNLRWVITIADTVVRYDAAADRWRNRASMAVGRYSPGISVAGGGDVVVTGGLGEGNVPLASAERYDAAADVWRTLPAMAHARAWHVQATLPSGRVLVAGGIDESGNAIGEAEVYDPDLDTWQVVASLPLPVAMAASTPLRNGDVLVAGGFQEGFTKVAIPQVVAYRESEADWLSLPPLHTGRFDHSAVQLDDGRVLVVAGFRHYTSAANLASGSEITSVPLL